MKKLALLSLAVCVLACIPVVAQAPPPPSQVGVVVQELPTIACCSFAINFSNLLGWQQCNPTDATCSFVYRLCNDAQAVCVDLPAGPNTLSVTLVKKHATTPPTEDTAQVGTVTMTVVQ